MSCFLTGTGTDVGKTVVTAALAGLWLARGRSVCVYKPVQTGSTDETDTDPARVRRWVSEDVATHITYRFELPVAPYAADPERTIRMDRILADYRRLKREYDVLLVEGAGGLHVPVAPGLLMIDIIRTLQLPVVLVAAPHLGTINHILMSQEVLQHRRLEVQGLVISGMPPDPADPAMRSLVETLSPFLSIPLLAVVPPLTLSDGCLASGHPQLQTLETLVV